jgi:hypothetical protein
MFVPLIGPNRRFVPPSTGSALGEIWIGFEPMTGDGRPATEDGG